MKPDLRLYALVDPEHTGAHDLVDLTRAVARGGATLVQLRDKAGSTRQMVERARALVTALEGSGAPLIVNDRVDVALAAGAGGVHVGQDDMAVADARRLLGRDAIIGLSIKTDEQARHAPLDLLDYVAIGGVFATVSKDNPDPPVGIEGLRRIAGIIRARMPGFPVCAIAGIDEGNAAGIVAAGVDGVAVISALSRDSEPSQAAARLRGVIDGALQQRGTS
ncbi:MAG TPA: thiamine phosphate synthase [Pseudolabrys sp.]|nr:thiamine phosphate synthase [Pseudolabrys sp.]